MGKKLPHTPSSMIKNGLRNIFLRSREHQGALKRDSYTCTKCHRKKTTKKGQEFKVQVHHLEGIPMSSVVNVVREFVIQRVGRLATLCPECHDKEPAAESSERRLGACWILASCYELRCDNCLEERYPMLEITGITGHLSICLACRRHVLDALCERP